MKNYIKWVIRWRYVVAAVTLIVTLAAISQARNLQIVIDPNTMLPQSHPYVVATNEVEAVFGRKHLVVIGISPKQGDIYQTSVLEKVKRVTDGIEKADGVIRNSVLSLSARKAKVMMGTEEGLEVKEMMSGVPQTEEELQKVRDAVKNNPALLDVIAAKDGKTAAIFAEFKDSPVGFRAIQNQIDAIADQVRDDSVNVYVGGPPANLAQIEKYSDRMGILLPAAILILGLVLYFAFRSVQGMVLPLTTALLAVACGLGVMGAAGIPMDMFNATTPILILAVATGHAVQMLKRYYEEYRQLRATTDLSPREANDEAVIESLAKVGPVMIAAGVVASLGFISLLVFDISTVRTFGVFTAVGILATLVLELTFIPALRSILKPPSDVGQKKEGKSETWERITTVIGDWVTGPSGRKRVYIGFAVFSLLAVAGMSMVTTNNATGSYFAPNLQFKLDDIALNERLAGTYVLTVTVAGAGEDAIKDPAILKPLDELQRRIAEIPDVGKTISIADFVKRMNEAMHNGDPAFNTIPDSQDLISQYLLLYSLSGEPGDFDSYVDNDYRRANMLVFVKKDSTAYTKELIRTIESYSKDHFPKGVEVRFGVLSVLVALNDVMVHGKILNILQIAAVVFVVASIVFRSLVAGFMVLLPLLVAVLANFGLMGWTGIYLNVATSLTSAMAVGIGADYAIYLLFRVREELEAGVEETQAVRNVIGTAGKAVLFVAVSVAAGYGVLLLSIGFNLHKWLSILIGTAMIVSALSALVLIPALLLTFRPKFIFGRQGAKLSPAVAAGAALLLASSVMMHSPRVSAAEADLTKIMEANFSADKVVDSVSQATFTLINKDGGKRVRNVSGTTKLAANGIDNMRVTRFMSPPDVKGTAVLLIEHSDADDDMWIYLPALGKVRRLVSNDKKSAFVGTDFSFGDVIGYKVKEWTYELLKEEQVEGQPCYVIQATPKTDAVKASSGYAKRVVWVRKDNSMTAKSEAYDLQGALLKTATFSDIRQTDAGRGKWNAMHVEVVNEQTQHKTILHFDDFKANQDVKDNFFTTRSLEAP